MSKFLSFLKLIRLKKVLKKEGVVLAYLFGSKARGESYQESDVDIAVLFDEKIKKDEYLKKEGRLIGVFSEIYPKKEINIINLNISSTLLKQNVVLEGKPIYIKDKIKKILFQVSTLHQYEDYLHLSKIYSHFLHQRIKAL